MNTRAIHFQGAMVVGALLNIQACSVERQSLRTISPAPTNQPTPSPSEDEWPYAKGDVDSMIECRDGGSIYSGCRLIKPGQVLIDNSNQVKTEFTVPYEFRCPGGVYRSEIFLTAGPVDAGSAVSMREHLLFDTRSVIVLSGIGPLVINVANVEQMNEDIHPRGCALLIDPNAIKAKPLATVP